MKKSILHAMLEAYRRWIVLGRPEDTKPLGAKWLGLGCEGEYRQTLKEGYMKWVHTPLPRTMGWLHLTPKGEEVFRKFAARGVSAKDFNNFDFTAWDKISGLWC
jgi:hypothetical protein